MKNKDIGGIYYIENIVNNKKYIGQSVNLERRKREHFCCFRNKTHKNPYFQNAFDKYGEENFIFKVLIYCESSEMTRYEQFFVNLYNKNELYNLSLECVKSTLGIHLSEEHKRKISKATTGKPKNKIGRKKYKNKILNKEHKKNISKAMLGNNNAKKKK